MFPLQYLAPLEDYQLLLVGLAPDLLLVPVITEIDKSYFNLGSWLKWKLERWPAWGEKLADQLCRSHA